MPSASRQPPQTSPIYTKPDKPQVPYCVNTFDNTHTCDDWEINSYNDALRQYQSDLEDYMRKLKRYVAGAESFAASALDYAKCEVESLD